METDSQRRQPVKTRQQEEAEEPSNITLCHKPNSNTRMRINLLKQAVLLQFHRPFSRVFSQPDFAYIYKENGKEIRRPGSFLVGIKGKFSFCLFCNFDAI